jgi:hypothetical protein
MLSNFELFLESLSQTTYTNKNIVKEISVAMCIINPEFLDKILDLGLRARYTENSSIYLTDLKSLLLNKNRLKLGKFVEDKCQEDTEISKINSLFEGVDFSFEDDFSVISDSRTCSRNICDKLILPDKLTPQMVSCVYWIGPNKTKDFSEDLVVELVDGRQFSLFLDKNFSATKSSSFQTFTDQIIPKEVSNLYSESYIAGWNKLVQTLVGIIYKYATSNNKAHIQKFIAPDRIPTLDWFGYFNIKHSDKRYQILGEYLREFDKNVVWFSDLINLIWKNGESALSDYKSARSEWIRAKSIILNSRILEHTLTQSLTRHNRQDISRLKSGMKLAKGVAKMKFVKTIVEKLGCLERDVIFVGKKGDDFTHVPSRSFFRERYEDLDIKFDYHVNLTSLDTQTDGDFKFLVQLFLKRKKLLDLEISIGFTGYLSEKLRARFSFTPVSDFNLKVSSNPSED